jgi:hypothetical protein
MHTYIQTYIYEVDTYILEYKQTCRYVHTEIQMTRTYTKAYTHKHTSA